MVVAGKETFDRCWWHGRETGPSALSSDRAHRGPDIGALLLAIERVCQLSKCPRRETGFSEQWPA